MRCKVMQYPRENSFVLRVEGDLSYANFYFQNVQRFSSKYEIQKTELREILNSNQFKLWVEFVNFAVNSEGELGVLPINVIKI